MNKPSRRAQYLIQIIRSKMGLIVSISALGIGFVSPGLLAIASLVTILISGFVAPYEKEGKGKWPWRASVSLMAGWLFLIAIPTGLNLIGENHGRSGFHCPAMAQDIGRFLQESPVVDHSYLESLQIEKVSLIQSADRRNATFKAVVKNNGTKTVLRLSGIIQILDNNNRVIDTKTMIDYAEILPGKAKEISTYTEVPAESKFCRISLTEVQVMY